MKLQKRDCGIEMKLVPYGAGWTDVYLSICGDNHYFIISNVLGAQFEDFLNILYFMYPKNFDGQGWGCIDDVKYAVIKDVDEQLTIEEIVDKRPEHPCSYIELPWKAHFEWDEEGDKSHWEFERDPTENHDFSIKINIDHKGRHYQYQVRYADLCYSVGKACTEALKKHGFTGYHSATYTQDLNIRQLLFIKGIALDNLEACKLTYYQEKGQGETSDFKKELELLLFDM